MNDLHRDAVHVRVIHEPDDLVGEQLGVVLRRYVSAKFGSTASRLTDLAVQVRLGRLRRVQLETLPDTLSQDVARRVRLHDLRHCLLNEGLHAGEPVAERRPQVVRKVHANHHTGRGRVQAHRVGNVIEELGASVALDVVRVEVAPAQLHINPVLVARGSVQDIFVISDQRRTSDIPLVSGEEEDIGARPIGTLETCRW